MTARPADACPYPKPFPPDFTGCPAYQTRHAIVTDSTGRPLRTIWSCRHLETKQMYGERGRYYGACQLGDAHGRQQWVQRIGADRIRYIQYLRQAIIPFVQVFVDDLAALKGKQLANGGPKAASPVMEEMRERGRRYLSDFEMVLKENQFLLDAAQMPLGPVMQLAQRWVDELIAETTGRQAEQHLPDDLLAQLPESVSVFYAPPL